MRYGVAAALPAGDRAARGALRRLLTPTFRLENLLVFIPLRVVAAESGAAQFDRRGRRISFVLVELLIGAAGRRWSSGGRAVEVRGRGRVAGGRSSGQGGSASSAHSDFPAGKSAGLYPFAGGGRRIWRGAVARCSRPARAAEFVRFSGIVHRALRGDDGARAVGLLMLRGRAARVAGGAIERPGGLCVVCSLRLSGWKICWSLSLCGWWPPNSGAAQFDRRGRRISFVLVELLIGAAGRRWSSGGRAVEVRGRGRVAGGRSSGQGGSASSAHSDFPAGKSAGLYPFAGGGRQSGAAQFDRRGRRISFVLVELLIGAAGRRWSSGGRAVEVRGRGRVAGGRSSGQGGSASSAHSDFPAGKSAGLYPFAGGGRRIWRGAVRPARAADFVRFSGIVDRRCGATMELGRSGC